MSPTSRAASPRSLSLGLTLQLLFVVLIWGLNFSVSKWALRELPPLGFTALRFALASLLLLAALAWKEGSVRPPPGGVPRLALLGVVGNSVYQVCFILGLSLTTATNSSLVLASMPAVVAGLGAVFGIERLSARGAQGLVLATVGVVMVVAARGISFGSATFRGDALTFGAVVCWAGFTIGVRRLALPMSALAITTWTMVFGTPVLIALGLPSLLRMDWGAVSGVAWAGLVYSSALSLVVAYVLWNNSVRVVGSSQTAVFACITPLVAMGSAILMLGERPLPVQLLGTAAVLGGVLLAQLSPAAPRPRP